MLHLLERNKAHVAWMGSRTDAGGLSWEYRLFFFVQSIERTYYYMRGKFGVVT